MSNLVRTAPTKAFSGISTRFPAVRGALLAMFATALLAGHGTAGAETVFNITGTGCVADLVLKGDGSIDSGCFVQLGEGGYSLTGTVTLDVYGAPSTFSTDPLAAGGTNWVTTSFDLYWTGPTSGSYNGQLPGATTFDRTAVVVNGFVSSAIGYEQELASFDGRTVDDGANQSSNTASLIRYTTDPTSGAWLPKDDLTFVETAGLAPGPNATNVLSFLTIKIIQDVATGNVLALFPGSRSGTFLLTSMTIAAIPEPDTGLLALVGVAAVGVVFGGRSRRRLGSGLA